MEEQTRKREPITPEGKPWPLRYIFIIVLSYITLQTAYFLLFG